MNYKSKIISLFDYAEQVIERARQRAEQVKKNQDLTEQGKRKAIDKAYNEAYQLVRGSLMQIAELYEEGANKLKEGWLEQADSFYNDSELVNILKAWQLSEPTPEMVSRVNERYQDNPIARQELKKALEKYGDIAHWITADERLYNADLLEKSIRGIKAMADTGLDEQNILMQLLELGSRKEFTQGRLNDDLSLVK